MKQVKISEHQDKWIRDRLNRPVYELLSDFEELENQLGIYFYQGVYYDNTTKDPVLIVPFRKQIDQLKLFD